LKLALLDLATNLEKLDRVDGACTTAAAAAGAGAGAGCGVGGGMTTLGAEDLKPSLFLLKNASRSCLSSASDSSDSDDEKDDSASASSRGSPSDSEPSEPTRGGW